MVRCTLPMYYNLFLTNEKTETHRLICPRPKASKPDLRAKSNLSDQHTWLTTIEQLSC
jgi:hypothetical protein